MFNDFRKKTNYYRYSRFKYYYLNERLFSIFLIKFHNFNKKLSLFLRY